MPKVVFTFISSSSWPLSLAAYAIAIRGAEFPDAELQGILLEPGGDAGGYGDDRKKGRRGRNVEDGEEDEGDL